MSAARQWGRRRRRLAAGGVILVTLAALFALQPCMAQGGLTLRRFKSPSPGPATTAGGDLAAAALVLYNGNDSLSHDLADYYAAKRRIDPDRVVGLNCPAQEEISREEYDQTIAGPLRDLFDARGWWIRSPGQPGSDPASVVSANKIRYLVLMRGIPLKIRETTGYPGDNAGQPSPIGSRNAACVDSELAVLGLFTHRISGILANPYFRSYDPFIDVVHPAIMLAARLDAPDGATVRRMIDDSLAVEKTGLWGRCYVDGRGLAPGSDLAQGDVWLKKIATEIVPYSLPTIYDNEPAMFAADYPMTEAALYFGWYSEQPMGALADEHFQFLPGAVACHIHSYSATSLRDPAHWWVAPLLAKGAAAVLGNVYEPYLSLTTHLDIFADRLCSGMTFADSAYAATPALSWMNTFVGDPLYCPCAAWKDLEFEIEPTAAVPSGPEPDIVAAGKAYYKGANIWHAEGSEAGAKILANSAARLRSGRIYEGLGLLQAAAHNLPTARAAFQQAGRYYSLPADRVRAILDEAHALVDADQKPAAMEVLEAGRRNYGTTGAAGAFGELEAQIGVNPPASATP